MECRRWPRRSSACAQQGASSPLDTPIGEFYKVLADARKGREVGAHPFEGEDFERWALKMMLGYIASDNVRWHKQEQGAPRDSAPVPAHPISGRRHARWMWFFLRGRSRQRLQRRSSQRRDQQLSATTHGA